MAYIFSERPAIIHFLSLVNSSISSFPSYTYHTCRFLGTKLCICNRGAWAVGERITGGFIWLISHWFWSILAGLDNMILRVGLTRLEGTGDYGFM